jgi:nitrite reductase (cytochrome c-552)
MGRLTAGAFVVVLCGVLGVGCGLLGCSPRVVSGADGQAASADGSADETKTMNQWGEEYPLQYNSYATIKVNPEDGDKEGHYCMRTKELGPIARDERGYKPLRTEDENYNISWLTYDDVTGQWIVDESNYGVVLEAKAYKKGCFSCRSSKFQEIEAREGADIYNEPLDEEFLKEINGQAWDCAICHGDNPANPADSQLTYFNNAAGDHLDELLPTERVCGQCHTTMSHTSEDPYRFGFDVDGLFDGKVAQGQTSTDDETGITTVTGIYEPDVEFLQGSTMRELGVACVNCHMPKVTDPETGQIYTSHNASGSPLASEDSLKYCLTCHESRGIKSTDEMVKMVRGLQEETGKQLLALEEKCGTAKELFKTAATDGKMDEQSLDKLRDKYARAYARYQITLGDANVAGMKVVHNPEKTKTYIAEADKMLDEIIAALG